MKTPQRGKKKVFTLILVAIGFSACKTDLVYMNVTEPAPVSMSHSIKIIGVINRSMASEETKK